MIWGVNVRAGASCSIARNRIVQKSFASVFPAWSKASLSCSVSASVLVPVAMNV